MLVRRSGAGSNGPDTPSAEVATLWDAAVDLLLQRAALIARVQRDRAPDPLAGLKVDDEDLSALLGELPGLESGDAVAAEKIVARLERPLATARERLGQALQGDNPLGRIVAAAALTRTEAEVLAVLCAVESDPRRQRLVGYLNDDVTQRRMTLWSLFLLFGRDEELVAAVGPGGGLRRAALLAPPGENPWAADPIVPAPAVLWRLSGARYLDPDLPPGVELISAPGTGNSRLLVASGPDRRRRLEAIVGSIEAPGVLVSPVPAEKAQWDALVREATIFGAGLVLEIEDRLSAEARDRIERASHLSWALSSPTDLPIDSLFRHGWSEVEVAAPEASEKEWLEAFPDLDRTAVLAGPNYRLSAQQLQDVRRAAEATGGDLREAVRRLASGHIDATATRIQPSRTWDDLILDDERMAQVREIATRQRRRETIYEEWGFSSKPSTGVIALFAGVSGTGKTLAAEIVAGDLGVDLYKVDLANLVSKYIGETEKNLSKIFEAAEASRVVLFFDEADALLGKRSEVADAHDRYANIEVAYLLQRLESYDGVAVLATNLVNNLDEAFLRRLHIVVEFPMPQVEERRKIWARSLPPGAPLAADLDLDRLAAEVEVSGGTIRNVVLRAAFLAADEESPITMRTMLTALRRELEKIGRLAIASEWGRVFD